MTTWMRTVAGKLRNIGSFEAISDKLITLGLGSSEEVSLWIWKLS